MAELRAHVREELAEPDGVVVIDPSAFPKKGTESCGVARQWCGRLGKVDNCQVGVFLAYAADGGYAPLDRRLYLPEDWAGDEARREKCHVPPEVAVPEKWQIALDSAGPEPARACPTAGSPATTSSAGPPSSAPRCACGRSAMCWTCRATPRCATWSGVARRASGPASAASARCRSSAPTPGRRASRSRGGSGSTVRDGEKGPLVVDAMTVRVRAKQDGPDRAGGAAGGDPAGRASRGSTTP